MGRMKDLWIDQLNDLSDAEWQEWVLKNEPMVLAAIEQEKAKGNVRASYSYRVTASGVEILGPPECLRVRWTVASVPEELRVPARAECALSFLLPKTLCEALLGDLQERFCQEVHARGRSGATRWYWTEAILALCTLAPVNVIKTAWFLVKFGR